MGCGVKEEGVWVGVILPGVGWVGMWLVAGVRCMVCAFMINVWLLSVPTESTIACGQSHSVAQKAYVL